MARTYRFELVGNDNENGQEWVTGWHYQTDLPGGSGEDPPADVLDAILSHLSSSGHNMTHFLNCMYSDSSLEVARLRAEEIPSSGIVPVVATEVIGLQGNLSLSGTNPTPSGLAIWLKAQTDAAIRSARGGTHLPPPLSVAAIDSQGQWNTGVTLWSNVVNLCGKMADTLHLGTITVTDIVPRVYSRTRRIRGFTPYTFDIQSWVPSNEPRWLRRRSPA